jgi:hypothetical protein
MSDIRLQSTFPTHHKTRKLAKLLGPQGPLSLLYLWSWVGENRPDGRLTGLTLEDIELNAFWPDTQPGAFGKALVELRFLDFDADKGEYVVHGWREHQPWVAGTEQRRESARNAASARWQKRPASAPDAKRMRPASDSHAPSTADRNAPSLSFPSPNQQQSAEAAKPPSPPAADPVFMTFPTVGKAHEWALKASELANLRKAFPAIDVPAEMRKAWTWVNANPSNRKTPNGMSNFLFRWLSNAQDRGGLFKTAPPQARLNQEQRDALERRQAANRDPGLPPMNVPKHEVPV